ncbi:MAG: LLM class F420-dependent oxidoreductase [SAR202 cluster bacterium]|jgi:probable F420-dependent oxidoreductase|nr:LLM class F420-dependent oxidoreductase [SAR202 cluster bacterium]|tara:strand:+ start:888 stop:1733 length:846 start_codon:yes stop_codon:yes gene_type:complete
MDIGISTFPTDYSIDIAKLAQRAEEYGFESLWVPEHSILPVNTESPWPGSPDGKIPKVYADIVDPFIALSRASAVTTKLKLGTGICLVPERNPLLLAKEVATLDMYSQGRFLFGIGAGWLREETEIMGGDFAHRWSQTRESILAMKELWTTVGSEYHGKYYDFPPVYSFPRSVQKPHPPVFLGGMAKNVFKRIIDYGDGWMPNRVVPEDVQKGRATLDELAEAAGRDPKSIIVSVFGQQPDADLLKGFEEAGADRVMIRVETANEEDTLKNLHSIAETVLN